MVRRSKREEDKLRSLKARFRLRERTAHQAPPTPVGLSPRSSDSAQPSDVLESSNAPVAPDDETPQGNSRLLFRTAQRLWELGEYRRAAASFRQLLGLENEDPRFARYWLASCLSNLGPSDGLDKLLEEFDDNSGIWRFAQALHAFRQRGDTDEARRLLLEAHRLEPGFETFLLQDGVVDASREVRFDMGFAERAVGCARLFLTAWRGVPGAAAWARRVLKIPPLSAHRDDAPRRFPQDELASLPLRRETWQVGLLPCRDEPHGHGARMWLLGVASIDRQEIRAATVIDQRLTEAVAWNALLPAFLKPMDGQPARPGTLVVGRREFCKAWKPLLAHIGVCCRYVNDPQPVGQLLKAMGDVIEEREQAQAEDIDIREFPPSDAVWQADFIRSPAWVMNEQEGPYRPWSVLVLEKSRSKALMTSHTPGDPMPEMLFEFLVRTMARPGGQSPQRPRLVEVSDSDCYDHLRPRLESAGIACRLVDELREFNDFCQRLARSFDGPQKCALADGPGITRAHMESFYEAAEYYFRQAPWRRVPGEVPIEVRCDDPEMGTRWAIVLGRTGVQLGLCVYDDWEMTRAMLIGVATADEIRGLTVCYDEPEIMAAVDLQWIDRLGWPIATPEAWPAVMRLQSRRGPRSPNAKELVYLDACLRAIPNFLKTRATSQISRVETGTREVELRLAWEPYAGRRK